MQKLHFLLVLILGYSSSAFCLENVIYLRTVESGSNITQAFGHSALEVETTNDEGKVDSIVYEYNGVNLDQFFDKFDVISALKVILDESVLVSASRTRPYFFVSRYSGNNRSIQQDKLDLTREQADLIASKMKEEFSTPGRKSYPYRSFSDNCATRVRDIVFSVLDPILQENLKKEVLKDESLKTVVTAALAETLVKYPKIEIVSRQVLESAGDDMVPLIESQIRMLGLKTSVSRSGDLFEMAENIQKNLKDPKHMLSLAMENMKARTNVDRESFQKSLNQFLQNSNRKDITAWDSLFTPKRLRQALVDQKVIH